MGRHPARGRTGRKERTELVVLGSGCFSPGRPGAGRPAGSVRNPPGYALRRGGQVLLFDFGFGNLSQLVRAGLDPDQVSHVFLTHRHPDHLGDLAALLFYYRYDGKPRRGRLRVYGPRGLRNFVGHLFRAYHPWVRPRGFLFSVEELEEPASVRGDGWRVYCRAVPHTTEALAYRYESREASFCYSGDTEWEPGLAGFASETDLFILECSHSDDERAPGHLRVSEALELARLSKARRVLFSHLSPSSERQLRRRLARRSGERLSLARDRMIVSLSR